MADEIAAPSPAAKPGDAKKGSENLQHGQALQFLIQADLAAQEKAKLSPPATAEIPPEAPAAEPSPTPVAEAPVASVETPPEAEAPAETVSDTPAVAETPSGEDDVLSSHSSLDQRTKEKIQKRIDKEVGKRKALESRIAELESSIKPAAEAAPPPPPVVLSSDVPLSHIADMSALQKLQVEAKTAIRFAEETLDTPTKWRTKVVPVTDPETGEAVLNPNTGEAQVQKFKVTKLGDQEVTEADLKAIMRRARVTLEDQIPQRAQFLQTQADAQQKAFATFPWLKDKTAPEYQLAQEARRRQPWLATLPNADWVIGVQIEGIKSLQAREAKAKSEAGAKPKPKTTAKPSSDQVAVSATSTSSRLTPDTAVRQGVQAERESLLKKRGVTTAEAVASLKRLDQLRNSR